MDIKQIMQIKLWLLAVVTLFISILVPEILSYRKASWYNEKKAAVELAAQARHIVGEKLLGVDYSEITTTLGYKDAKILSAAPDFPALIVEWLKTAGIKKGDTVAINSSGSFPALTIASVAAVHAIEAKPLLITSLGASSWGANRPDYTWLHMETELVKTFPFYKSIAVSFGGDYDTAYGMSDEGKQILTEAMKLTDAVKIVPSSIDGVVSQRLEIWKKYNNGVLPDIMINVGGNLAFWGTEDRDSLRDEGLIMPTVRYSGIRNGVGEYYLKEGKPVIHLLGIKKIAAKYSITIPSDTFSPLWQTPEMSLFIRIGLIITAFVVLYLIKKIFTT